MRVRQGPQALPCWHFSLCLSCLVTEAAARTVEQGLLRMAPRREAGIRLMPPDTSGRSYLWSGVLMAPNG